MYLSYWGLGESPFRANLDARSFHQGLAQEESLARLQFLVDERRTLGLLVGASGSGKSMLLEVLAGQLSRIKTQTALLRVAGIDLHEFLWLAAGQLGVEVSPHASQFTLARTVVDHLIANRYQQITSVLLIDDADEAREDVLVEVARLAQINVDRNAQMTIVLAAQPGRIGRIGMRLLDLAELRIDVEPWEADETSAYIKTSLARAGRSTPAFNEAALARLHELSGGIPRRVQQLADLALLAGAGQNLGQIDAEVIDTVIGELGIVSTSSTSLTHAWR
jgi:type II secretory pathway predicted ATPase ExeA